MITFNEVYTKARAAAISAASNAFVTSTYTPTPSKFPAVFIREVGEYTPTRYISLSSAENVKEMTLEVQIFSNKKSGAKTEVDTIFRSVESALKAQYFYLVSSAPVENVDSTVYRHAARFRRTIGGADTIQ